MRCNTRQILAFMRYVLQSLQILSIVLLAQAILMRAATRNASSGPQLAFSCQAQATTVPRI